MNRYKISQRAEQDLEDIWIYVAQTDWVICNRGWRDRGDGEMGKERRDDRFQNRES